MSGGGGKNRRPRGSRRDRDERRVLAECAGVLASPGAAEIWSRSSNSQRGALVLALRAAARSLLARRPCDLCPAPATRARFVLVRPDEDFRAVRRDRPGEAITGVATLCARCARRPGPELQAAFLDKYAALQPAPGAEPQYLPVILGRPVGAVAGLPPRRALADCGDCGAALWYDQDEQDWAVGRQAAVLYLCPGCAERRHGDGRLDSVSGAILGGDLPAG